MFNEVGLVPYQINPDELVAMVLNLLYPLLQVAEGLGIGDVENEQGDDGTKHKRWCTTCSMT